MNFDYEGDAMLMSLSEQPEVKAISTLERADSRVKAYGNLREAREVTLWASTRLDESGDTQEYKDVQFALTALDTAIDSLSDLIGVRQA